MLVTGLAVEYANGRKFPGDSVRGEKLWQLSCGRCHGLENMAAKAKCFTEDLDRLHKMIADGTRYSGKPCYRPYFTLRGCPRTANFSWRNSLRKKSCLKVRIPWNALKAPATSAQIHLPGNTPLLTFPVLAQKPKNDLFPSLPARYRIL